MAPYSPDQIPHTLPPAAGQTSEPAVQQWTTVAMERFACAADRCEDTCCRDWAVEIDKGSLERMRAAMGRTEEGRQKLVRLVVLGRPSQHAGGSAHLKMNDDGACPMLDESQLCGIQSAHGENTLSTACSVFPRTALQAQGELEIGGSLACPETARLMLFAEPGALELRPASKEMLPRAYVGRTVPGRETGARAAAFRPVRAAMTRLLRAPGYPLASRMTFVVALADRLDPFLRDADEEGSGARRAFALRRLEFELAQAEAPSTQQALHRDLGQMQGCGDEVVSLIATLLIGRKRLPHAPRFGALLRDAFSSLQEEALGRPASPEDAVAPAALWAVYRRRRDALQERLGAQVDALFANYSTHYLQRHPSTEMTTLLSYAYKMALHMGALRLLLVGHPALVARSRAPADSAADEAALREAAVHVVQTYTKAVGHSVEFQEAVMGSVPTEGLFGQAVMLAKFL